MASDEELQSHPTEFWMGLSALEWSSAALRNSLKKYCVNPKVVVDIGANMGFATKCFYEIFKPQIIHAIEPGVEQLDILRTITRKIPPAVLRVHECGVFYGKTESVFLLSPDGNSGGATIEDVGKLVMGYSRPAYEYTVKLKTLEELVDGIPDFVKIDVEGSEYNIIENSQILKQVPVMMVEWHSPNINAKYPDRLVEFIGENLPNHTIVETDFRGSTILTLKD